MRVFALALGIILVGCATTTENEPIVASAGLSAKALAAGECGLYVWTADAVKTFTLFASPSGVSYLNGASEISLTEKNPTTPPATNREFVDETGKILTLTLLTPQDIEGGTRYKTGRLTSVADDGWEKVVPIVGLYACQPDI